MKELKLMSWEEFEAAISSLFSQLETIKAKTGLHVSTPLFRGQTNSSWGLETTLDRMIDACSMENYHKMIRGVRPAIVSITGKSWDLPDHFNDDQDFPRPPPGYEFMIYLRHHGFPSPLLDWSRSPYVAAFFAFRSKGDSQDSSGAIYSYVEYLGGAKTSSSSQGTIVGLGPYVISHPRHFAQQCEYTICKKKAPDHYVYCRHEEAILNGETGQDQLIRYILPKSERGKALKKLETMNITAYSLFRNEESLAETLAYQEIEKFLLQ